MAPSRTLRSAALLSLPLLASAQSTGSIQSRFPPAGQIADILDGDTVALNLYNSIISNAGGAAAVLNYPANQITGVGGTPVLTGYDYQTDQRCWWSASGCHTPKVPGVAADLYQCPAASTWGLSVDDGPNPAHDPYYDFLRQNNLRATMFYIGTNVMNNPAAAQRGVRDGHQVCGHTWSHRPMTTLTNRAIFAELYYTQKVIKDVTGVTTKCWRPAQGDTDDRVRFFASALKMTTILWDNDTNDFTLTLGQQTQVEANYARIIASASSGRGTLVLNHEVSLQAMNEFIKQYPAISAAFRHVVPALTCYNITNPYYEQDVSFPNFAQFAAGQVNATIPSSVSSWTIQDVTINYNQAGPDLAQATRSVSISAAPSTTSSVQTMSASMGSTTSSATPRPSSGGQNTGSAQGRGSLIEVGGSIVAAALLSAALLM